MPKIRKKTRKGKALTIAVAVFGVLAGGGVAAVGGMYMAGVITFQDESTHIYYGNFFSEGKALFTLTREKGEAWGDIPTPSHSEVKGKVFTFRGWDTTGDGFPNILPKRAYGALNAYALFYEAGVAS